MRYRKQLLVVGIMLVAAVAGAESTDAAGQPEQSKEDNTPKTTPLTPVESLMAAGQLAKHARAVHSPELLLAAATLIQGTVVEYVSPPSTEKTEPRQEGGDTSGFTSEALLDEAKEMADGDSLLTALIQRRRNAPVSELQFMGKTGAKAHGMRGAVEGDGRSVHEMVFRAGELAEVAVIGSGRSDLDVEVKDEGGREVASSRGPGDDCTVEWWPLWKGTFTVTVINRGSEPNDYLVFTN